MPADSAAAHRTRSSATGGRISGPLLDRIDIYASPGGLSPLGLVFCADPSPNAHISDGQCRFGFWIHGDHLNCIRDVRLGADKCLAGNLDHALIQATTCGGEHARLCFYCDVHANDSEIARSQFQDTRAAIEASGLRTVCMRIAGERIPRCEPPSTSEELTLSLPSRSVRT
jgi:hypothetical protein